MSSSSCYQTLHMPQNFELNNESKHAHFVFFAGLFQDVISSVASALADSLFIAICKFWECSDLKHHLFSHGQSRTIPASTFQSVMVWISFPLWAKCVPHVLYGSLSDLPEHLVSVPIFPFLMAKTIIYFQGFNYIYKKLWSILCQR